MQGYSIIYADHSTTTIRGAAQGVASLSPRTSCWLKFPHSALHFHIRKCFRARKCHRGREYYSTQRKSNLPGREWNSATRGIGNETRGAYRKLDGDEWRRQEALATNVGTED